MAPNLDSKNIGGSGPSSRFLEEKKGDAVKATRSKIAADSARRAGNRIKRNEANQGLFSK